jgi:Zn-dependent M16 (insulinase) family peptidase
METFTNAASYLQNLDMSEDELEKAIIGAVGQLDKYLLPDAKGFAATQRYLIGYTDVDRQQLRDEVLATTLDDFRKFGDVLMKAGAAGRVVVTGSPNSINDANGQLIIPLRVTAVM